MSLVTVGDLIISDESGFAYSKTKLVASGLPHLRPFNIADDGSLELSQIYQVPATAAPPSKAQLLAGDILFNNTNTADLVGKSALVLEDMIAGFSNHLTRVRVDGELLNPAWFSYWLRYLRTTGYFTTRATQWVSQAAYRITDLEKIQIDLPNLEKQRRAVDLLTRAEGIVRLRHEAQKKAFEIIPALFVYMFGDPTTNPKGWPTVKLSEVSEVISGVAKGRKLTGEDVIELPYMRVANVKDGLLDLTGVKTIEIRKSEVARLRIQPGDLLMTEGGDPDKLGRAALWRGEIDLCVHQNHIFKVRSDRTLLSPTYLRSLAGSFYGKAYFLSVAKKTTGIASINKTQLSAFPVVVPPIKEQIAFEKHVSAIESIQALQAAALRKAESAFSALLASSFLGGSLKGTKPQ